MTKRQPLEECDLDLEDVDTFIRSCMESHEDGLRNGCATREEIEQTTREAIRLGLEDRERDRLAAVKRAG